MDTIQNGEDLRKGMGFQVFLPQIQYYLLLPKSEPILENLFGPKTNAPNMKKCQDVVGPMSSKVYLEVVGVNNSGVQLLYGDNPTILTPKKSVTWLFYLQKLT